MRLTIKRQNQLLAFITIGFTFLFVTGTFFFEYAPLVGAVGAIIFSVLTVTSISRNKELPIVLSATLLLTATGLLVFFVGRLLYTLL